MKKIKTFLKRYYLLLLIVIAFVYVGVAIILPTFSVDTTSSVWDGTVATSFASGSGTSTEPYEINNGSELAYLFNNVLTDANYNTKYYKLTNNIDMNGYDFSRINTGNSSFSGVIDGSGYSIYNFTINNYNINTVSGINEYSLIPSMLNANIKDINFFDVTMTIDNINTNSDIAFLTNNMSNSNISNVSAYNITLNITSINEDITTHIGGLITNDLGGNTIKNINIALSSNITNNIGYFIYDVDSSSISNILVNNTLVYGDLTADDNTNTIYPYTVVNNELSINEGYDKDALLTLFNKNSSFKWVCGDNNFYLKSGSNTTYENVTINEHASGIDGTTIYINDFESDTNYYTGLNYTYSASGTTPTINNKNIYNNTNLAHVMMTYNGSDETGAYVGYVSLTERQNTYIYYKLYEVNNNGTPDDNSDDYVQIELIDNPFYANPTDRAFNGWVSDYLGSTVSYDSEEYLRYIKIPVTYTSGVVDNINVKLYASWTTAHHGEMSSSWSNAFADLDTAGLHELGDVITYQPYDMSGYYHQKTAGYYERYSGYNQYGSYVSNRRCRQDSCTYYTLISNENYVEGETYYVDNGWQIVELDPSTLDLVIDSVTPSPLLTGNMAGYFTSVVIPYASTKNGYYDASGNATSGTCFTSSGCSVYKLLQYYDASGNQEIYNSTNKYYYLATRDTNIITLTSNVSSAWSQDKPFTLTSLYNGVDNRNNYTWTVSSTAVQLYADTNLSYLNIYNYNTMTSEETNPSTSARSGSLMVNRFNLKIGRGIQRSYNNYTTFSSVVGTPAADAGSSSALDKYKIIIESGWYNSLSLVGGASTSSYYDYYIHADGVYGSDYDRITANNDNLNLAYCACGSWGNNIYSTNNTDVAVALTVKSGSFGTNKYDYSTGIYVGGRYGGTHYAARSITVEGGYIYNLIGGPLSASNRDDLNDIYVYIKGGEIDMITGGAGRSTTYGNRIIQMSGGKVNYSIFAGSNGSEGSSSDGTLKGDGYIYIGGSAVVGDDTVVANNSTLSGAEAGSVFGIGNGRSGSGYEAIGSCDNANVVIDGNALIKRNIYGGGNFGATGYNSDYNSNTTNISINSGTINGSVYGGGNNNGAGTSSKTATININMYNGTVKGSVYGGSKSLGTIYGSTNVNIIGGTIATDVYGGGEGGYDNSTNSGTFVKDNVNVVIGDTNSGPQIDGSVYGGSAYGTVNAISTNASSNSNTTDVTVNNGTITGSVFGCAKGSNTYTPYVKGNVKVNINGGTITTVYGGFNQAGVLGGTDFVYLNGGAIGEAFGAGNNVGLDTTNIYLQGSTVTDLYGGANQSGSVTTTNVKVTTGTVTNIYGGNNIGGTCTTTNIDIDGSTINGTIYGGGNQVDTVTTNVNLNNAENTVPSVFGGGNQAGATTTNVNINGMSVASVFGGSNQSGVVNESHVNCNSGTVTNIFGGNNNGGSTMTTNVIINEGTITNIFGGGNQAESTTTNVRTNGGLIDNLYGGGNQAGAATTNVNLVGGIITNAFGGSNKSGTVITSNIATLATTVTNDVDYSVSTSSEAVTWQSTIYKTITTVNITIKNNSASTLSTYSGVVRILDSILYTNYSNTAISENSGLYTFNQANRYYGTNTITSGGTYTIEFTVLSNTDASLVNATYGLKSSDGTNNYMSGDAPFIGSLYGGNNAGGATTTSNVIINTGSIIDVYGGGNQAAGSTANVTVNNGKIDTLYGGGNAADISGNTIVKIKGGSINTNAYGGGNEGKVNGNTSVNINAGLVKGSIYAGGNGTTAIVLGNTNITVSGTSIIGYSGCKAPAYGSVFGGGNAAPTGTIDTNNSVATVNIAGGTIYGNVYGGANTSVVYGTTVLNIGADVTTNTDTIKGDININGTVFGGGEANASGSDTYDYSFISVTKGITVNINALNYDNFAINGSIFGSGNASSTTGTSVINISNYGTFEAPKNNISIQRTNKLVIDNSAIDLKGTTDRTNEYSDVLFTLSIIDELDLKNNSTLYLQTGFNLVKMFKSLTSTNEIATVTIDSDTKSVTKNVDNRIYAFNGKNLNIAKNEAVTSYGEVYGMTFFGMYKYTSNGSINRMIYSKHEYGDTLSWGDMPDKGSYVLGLHMTNHDIKTNGFYSNFMDNETTTNKIDYITPTPADSNFYMWIIGEVVSEYNVNLTASRYSTLGAVELSLLDFSKANTSFNILGFDYSSITDGVSLVSTNDIPRIANTSTLADTVMGLTMKTSNTGWLTNGSTSFMTSDTNPISGTRNYVGDNSTAVPTLLFYLYHSKNIGSAGDMGTVQINVMAITKIDDLTSETKRLVINVNMSRALYTTNDYEAGITAGRQYSMFTSTVTNITAKSAFSAYFSLYAEGTNIYKTGYHRALVSSYVLPLNTKITMIDLSSDTTNYYYHTITETDVVNAQNELATEGDISYDLAMFETMGAENSGVNYDDAAMNALYYNSDRQYASEEFIFIVDFSDTNITADSLNNSILMELQDVNNETMISVLGIEHASMVYSLYTGKDAVIDINGTGSSAKLYNGKSETLEVTTNYTQSMTGANTIYDTRYFDSKLGIKISLINSAGEVVTGTSLMGLNYTINGVQYYPNIDGSTRIKIADKVGNVKTWIKVDTMDADIATGQYNIRIESFGSPDGIYYGLTASDYVDIPVYIINEIYGLDITTEDSSLLIDSTTGKNMAGTTNVVYNINYNSGLTKPNIHMKLYRRNYNVEYDTTYSLVDLRDYVQNTLSTTENENEYLVADNPNEVSTIGFELKNNLLSGTYKLEFILYDDTTAIGTVEKYIFIK